MKIVYIANQRRVAEIAARGLYNMRQGLTVTWVRTHAAAASWVQANRDAAAIVLETALEDPSAASFVEQIRGLGLVMPIVMIVPQHSPRPDAALAAGADGYVIDGPSLERDLPRIVTAAIERVRVRRDVLVRKLRELEALRAEALQQAARAEEARQQTEQRSATETAAGAARLAALQAQHTASLIREAKVCAALQERLFELEARLRDANEQRAAESTASADRLLQRHTEFIASLARAAEVRETLEKQLSESTAALEEAQTARKTEAAAAAGHLAARETELGAALEHAAAGRAALERALTDVRAAAGETERRAAADLAAASDRQAALEDRLAREEDTRTVIERNLALAEAAQQAADERHATELAASAMRLAEAQSRHDTAVAESARLARRETELVEQLARETAARTALEENLGQSRTESAAARRRFLHAISTHRLRTQANRSRLEAQLAGERAESQHQLDARAAEIGQLQGERDALRHSLETTQEQVQLLQTTIEEERLASDRERLASESELQRLSGEADRLRASLDQARHAFQELEEIAGAHALERGRLEKVVAERDADLAAQAARHLAAEQAALQAFTETQDSLRLALQASSRDLAQLQHEASTLAEELNGTRARAEALSGAAERVPALQSELDESRKSRRRQFERAPYGLCECTRDGVITRINHSLVRLLGYRKSDELIGVDLAATAFECPDDLRWLIERAVRTGRTETAESAWRPKDRPRLVVRLQALATANASIEIVAEDMTAVRALEERLRRAQRIEAVGRFASEVAVTCDTLLRDVAVDGERWLGEIGRDAVHGRRAEQLLTDVRRARSVLRQFVVFGKEQARTLERVSLTGVLRDLTPVLEQIAGDGITFEYPKTAGSFEVDVDAGRVERVFVNVARYARERMPRGGQVRIELATTVVGARFTARYPNVRPGSHGLITVTELGHHADGHRSSDDNPGVDVTPLGELVADCGGHLWMEAGPSGSLVLKIHLPKRAAEDASGTAAPIARPRGVRRLTDWLRGKSEVDSAP